MAHGMAISFCYLVILYRTKWNNAILYNTVSDAESRTTINRSIRDTDRVCRDTAPSSSARGLLATAASSIRNRSAPGLAHAHV